MRRSNFTRLETARTIGHRRTKPCHALLSCCSRCFSFSIDKYQPAQISTLYIETTLRTTLLARNCRRALVKTQRGRQLTPVGYLKTKTGLPLSARLTLSVSLVGNVLSTDEEATSLMVAKEATRQHRFIDELHKHVLLLQ